MKIEHVAYDGRFFCSYSKPLMRLARERVKSRTKTIEMRKSNGANNGLNLTHLAVTNTFVRLVVRSQ